MENNPLSNDDEKINLIIRRKTILSITLFFIAIILAVIGWKWLNNQPLNNEQPVTLRKVLKINEKVNTAFFSENNLAREYPKSEAAKNVRVNGDLGMSEDFNPIDWKLTVKKQQDNKPGSMIQLNMEYINALPKHEVIVKFKCIERAESDFALGRNKIF